MAGFRALAEQVRDPRRSPSQRRQALRKCLERFAPYGHRATWHHLCARAGIAPDDRDPDPARLETALNELEEARTVWLRYERDVAARRKEEKHQGIRQPTALDDWHRNSWGGNALLSGDDTKGVTTIRLAVTLRRLIDAREADARRHISTRLALARERPSRATSTASTRAANTTGRYPRPLTAVEGR